MSDQLAHTPSEGSIESQKPPVSTRALLTGWVVTFLASSIGSLLAEAYLPSQMRIHWSFGGPYYGPEFAPTSGVLVAFPVLIAGIAVGGYAVQRTLRSSEALASVRSVVNLSVLGVLLVLLAVQALLIGANL